MGTPQYVDAGMLTGNIDAGGYSSSIYNLSHPHICKIFKKWNVHYIPVSEFCPSTSSFPGMYLSCKRVMIRKRIIEFFQRLVHTERRQRQRHRCKCSHWVVTTAMAMATSKYGLCHCHCHCKMGTQPILWWQLQHCRCRHSPCEHFHCIPGNPLSGNDVIAVAAAQCERALKDNPANKTDLMKQYKQYIFEWWTLC